MLLTRISFFVLTFHFLLNHITFVFLFNFSFSLFIISLLGSFYNKQNLLILLFCIELMLLSIGLNFTFISLSINKIGQLFMLFIITIASAESSIGLGLLVLLYRLKQLVNFDRFIFLEN